MQAVTNRLVSRHRQVGFPEFAWGGAHGKVVVRRQLKRRYVLAFFKKLSPCPGGPSRPAPPHHHWSRSAGTRSHQVHPDASGLT